MLTGDIAGKLKQKGLRPKNAKRLTEFSYTVLETIVDLGPDLIGTLIPGGVLMAQAAKVLIEKSELFKRLKNQNRNLLTLPIEFNQATIIHQYTNVLQALTEKRLLVIVLDDLQWADSASISLLFHLVRKIKEEHMFLIGTYRPNDIAYGRNGSRHPLEATINEIRRYLGDVFIDLTKTDQTEGQAFIDAINDSPEKR